MEDSQACSSAQDRIVFAAAAVFQERGAERSTLSEVALRANCSLYQLRRWFRTHDELVVAVGLQHAAQATQHILAALRPEDDYRACLREFGRRYVDMLLAPQQIAAYRCAAKMRPGWPGRRQMLLGSREQLLPGMQAFLQTLIGRQLLKPAEPLAMAAHLVSLLSWPVLPRIIEDLGPHDFTDGIRAAVDVFCRAYAPRAINSDAAGALC